MPTEPRPVTLADVVRRAVDVCELGAPADDRLGDLLERFEDADVPVRGLEDVELRLDEVLGTIDLDWEDDPVLAMAGAVAVYLAFRPDELNADAEKLLRLAARAEFDGHPPPAVAEWLAAAGVEA
ncbi:MAG: hypothetical protein QOF54_364 [Solirubrobacteraceae bacterium]|jgi:hypothetical protein|nr:hypothetical protein [Solirubrobacteraceae bacterium]